MSRLSRRIEKREDRLIDVSCFGVAANSFLLLGDGLMSLAEIDAKTRLCNGVDILTLSARDTAFANHNEDAREVDSFGTIAQRLGAKGVVASRWSGCWCDKSADPDGPPNLRTHRALTRCGIRHSPAHRSLPEIA